MTENWETVYDLSKKKPLVLPPLVTKPKRRFLKLEKGDPEPSSSCLPASFYRKKNHQSSSIGPEVGDKTEEEAPDGGKAFSRKNLNSDSANEAQLMGTSAFAMENRDPNKLNAHCQVMFDDVIGEPEGLRTPDGCWRCSVNCYDKSRTCCYVFLVVLCAPFIACCSGWNFACLAFNQIWCVGPCLRMWKINCVTIRKFWLGCLLALCSPCAEMCGMYFSKIKVRYQKLNDGNDSETTVTEYFNV